MSAREPQEIEGGEYIVEDDNAGETTTAVLCFGVCDMRIATIAANALNVLYIFVGAILSGIFYRRFWATFPGGLPGIILSGFGLYGAKEFELWAMYVSCAGFAIFGLLEGILLQWVGFVHCIIVLIPSAFLAYEMKNGILTADNYADQQYVSPEGMEFVKRAHAYIAPSIAT